ncbi:tripartite tricarboxylate transporter substrate binding protein [Roseomonas sp. SSH11]|uniref:Tripartite tricarboxylate transporter substrate binding protein n=1 Tax=Pararoseomonas baculiformis TaxID=2820812 RepID=A0ABS4AJ69_9PROT|nr:tripartite tricarboxylate transporter substrate binding protein [Pararoseomonas baculiformis]MBP0446560.1 tripartite tricarboxylate transporter substrate binding protein [Pararoseomonas baculiformis]
MESEPIPPPTRRRINRAALASLGLLAAPRIGRAQGGDFPNRALRIVVPFAAGSGSDVYSRFFGKKLSELLGQPVVVENRPGADGAIAVRSLQSDPPDGHTLFLGSNTPMAVNLATLRTFPYDPVKDLRPISGMTRSMALFMVPPRSPLRTVADLEERGRRQPAVQSGTYSVGYQLAAAQFSSKAGFAFETVLYRGLAQTLTDLMGQRIELAVIDSTGSIPTAKSGEVRALAVTGEQRHPDLPEVPTLRESGYPEAVHYSWTAFWVDARTPDQRVNALSEAMEKALAQPDSRSFIEANGAEIMPFGPERMREFQMSEIDRFRRAAEASNFQPQ